MIEERAFVIKITPYKDRYSFVKIFTENRGCIDIQTTIEKKKWDQQFRFSLQLFGIKKIKEYYRMQSRELINAYYYIREDIDAFFITNIVFDFIDQLIPYEENNFKIFQMTMVFMKFLKEAINKQLLLTSYLLKLLAFTGYGLDFSNYKDINSEVFFDANECKFVKNKINCNFCFSKKEYLLLRYLMYNTFEEIAKNNTSINEITTKKLLDFIINQLMQQHDLKIIQSIECLNWK